MLTAAILLTHCSLAVANELHDAAQAGNVEKIRQLVSQSPELLNSRSHTGMTPLHYAIVTDNADAAMALIRAGADIEAKAGDGTTPLQLAFRQKSLKVLREMISKTSIVYTSSFLSETQENVPKSKITQFIEERDNANEIVTTFLRANPANENINFANGMLCAALNDLSRANMAFERVLQVNPKNDRARLELARTYIENKQPWLAQEHLDIVMSNNPSAQLRRSVDMYLAKARKSTKRWQVMARGDAAFFMDSNINVGPNSSIINITPLIIGSTVITNFALAESSLPKDSEGYSAMMSISSGYDIGRPGEWIMTGDASAYKSWLGGDNRAYENLFGTVAIGARKTSNRSALHLKTQVTHINTGHEPLLNIYAISPSHIRAMNNQGTVYLASSFNAEIRDFDKLDYRDSQYFSINETIRRHFGEQNKHIASAGVMAAIDNTDSDIYKYVKFGARAGVDLTLPWKLTFYARGSYSYSNYDGKDAIAPEPRADNELALSAGLNYTINSRSGIDINHQRTSNSSTFDLYDYDRNVTTISGYMMF